MIYYIAYDISDTDARTQTAKQLESLGTRIQHSLFMCEMNPDQMEAVFKQLSALIDPECDSLHIYPVCKECLLRQKMLGKYSAPPVSSAAIL
ncbi:CRISPR-associated endonuclease Cas2 [Treponema vincentii]|uniref:CRISPR-associated endonuclease Cas2 n=1 Tax=Treponema vincentii TaxID=69710 RepID=UPI0035F53CFB